ncbi:MAG: gliding motility-associated C-terminal domain-containing protein [Ichthyobacteriaceae bacterium]|nr:gliding motility-associated C-terminal domain-containing protein [Ichthyobacteriaceae bacterium]
MKKLILILCILLFTVTTYATHNRAGEITYEQIGPLTYKVTITTYTKAEAQADRCGLEISWGDGLTDSLARSNGFQGPYGCNHYGQMIDANIKKNIYIGTHTYPSAGTYVLSMMDVNRNQGVLNIPNSVEEPFYIESVIKITSGMEYNNSPVLLNPPIDFGCINTPYIHNLAAYDVNGDSLSYKLANCRGQDGIEITTTYASKYNLDKIMVDKSGTIFWNTPILSGVYNIAVEITEHRKDKNNGRWIAIGKILRDVQIDVTACNNTPPTINTETKYCIVGGETLTFKALANDADGDNISFKAVGGVFLTDPPAEFKKLTNTPTPVNGTFTWKTTSEIARYSPYYLTLKANDYPTDQHNNPIQGISTQKVVEIRIQSPAVILNSVKQTLKHPTFDLNWTKHSSSKTEKYKIYRKSFSGEYERSDCKPGLPQNSGYELIKSINKSQTTYKDDSENLKIGVKYCYIITAVMKDDLESIASNYICATLKKTLPILTNISIENTSHSVETVGEIYVAWSKPTKIDEKVYPGPYQYNLMRSPINDDYNFGEVAKMYSLNDTTFTDENMDTYSNKFLYRVDLYDLSNSTATYMGSSPTASSPYLNITIGNKKLYLEIEKNVPWHTDSIIYYKEIGESMVFEEIGRTKDKGLVVENLTNGTEYCFKAKTVGTYNTKGIISPIYNNSQIACASPNLKELQCPPELKYIKDCAFSRHLLEWSNPNNTCYDNIIGYNIYHTPPESDKYTLFEYIKGENNTSINLSGMYNISGCYYITAIDTLGNETKPSNIECYSSCEKLILPNVFTPNGDGINDIFRPIWDRNISSMNFANVSEFNIEVFGRWGNTVFSTTNSNINWDGTNQQTGKLCSTSVYYYVCTFLQVDENNSKPTKIELVGYIHLIR